MSITKESQNNFACSSCSKTFTKLDILKRHIKRVHETPTFKCGTCGKLFIRSGILKRHEKSVHGGKNIFTCSTCDNIVFDFTHIFVQILVGDGS